MTNGYPNPCDKCPQGRTCLHGCPEWVKRVRTIWKQFNGYPGRVAREAMNQAETEKGRGNKYCYEHPDIVRRYLEKGPCEGCRCENTCDIPCAAYLRWWNVRMKWIRGRLGASD